MIPRRLRPARPAPWNADAVCRVCGAWMRMPQGLSERDRAVKFGFFWAGHQHEALAPIIDECTWDGLAALRQPCPATSPDWDGSAAQSGNVVLSASCPHCGSGLPYDHTLGLGRQMLAESEFRARHSQCQPWARERSGDEA